MRSSGREKAAPLSADVRRTQMRGGSVKDRKLANRGGGWALQPQRWMMFVDGENLTIRTQEFAKKAGLDLVEGPWYRKDTFLWLKGLPGTYNLANPTHPLQGNNILDTVMNPCYILEHEKRKSTTRNTRRSDPVLF